MSNFYAYYYTIDILVRLLHICIHLKNMYYIYMYFGMYFEFYICNLNVSLFSSFSLPN